MKNITRFDRKVCDEFGQHMEAVIKAEAAKFGLALVTGRGKFADDSLRFEVKFVCGGQETVEAKAMRDFADVASFYGLKPSDYGAIIERHGLHYRLVKINTRRGVKYPYECECVENGRIFRFTQNVLYQFIEARAK